MGVFSGGFRASRALAGMGLAAIVSSALFVAPAFADSRNVATYGVDLTAEQHTQVQNFFGEGASNAEVIYVNNDQERAYLSAYIPIEQIGDKTYSCALVQPTVSGGIHVKTANLTYVTSDMIAATLATSGVKNCDVVAVCPFKVSGTGALTGVLMAYEQASGQTLDPTKKDLANQELITTGSIAQTVGPDLATLIVNDVKANVIQQGVTETTDVDNIVNNVVNNIVNDYSTTVVDNSTTVVDNSTTNVDNSTTNVTVANPDNGQVNAADLGLSDEEMQALRDFAHALARQDYSYDDIKQTLEMVSKNSSQAAGVADPMAPEGANGDASSDAVSNVFSDGASMDEDAERPEGGDSAGTATDELPQDSILNQTNDVALGSDTVVDSTDPSTIADGVETRQDAQAHEKADDVSASDPDDPFADLTWDETTAGDSDDAISSDADQAVEVPGAADMNAADGALFADGTSVTDGTDGLDDSDGFEDGPAAEESANFAKPNAGGQIDDVLGLPQTLTAQGLTLTLERSVAATTLIEGVSEPLFVYENADGATGVMAKDGTVVLEAAYAQDGIEGIGDGWVLAASPAGATDVYREAAASGDSSVPAPLQLVATVNGFVAQAQASGDNLNVQTSDGALKAIRADGAPVDAVPAAIDDFSYAATPEDSLVPTEGGQPSDAAAASEAPAFADSSSADGSFEMGEMTETSLPTGDAGEAAEQADAGQPGDEAQVPVEGGGVQETDTATSSGLPTGAQQVPGTDGALWTALQPSGKTAVYDASGTVLFATEFDSVQVTADGAWLLVTDKTVGESALYRVELVPSA